MSRAVKCDYPLLTRVGVMDTNADIAQHSGFLIVASGGRSATFETPLRIPNVKKVRNLKAPLVVRVTDVSCVFEFSRFSQR